MATVDIVVVGSGITGLTIAQELLKKGYRPAVVAKDFADDAQSQGFASPWAVRLQRESAETSRADASCRAATGAATPMTMSASSNGTR